LINSYSIVKVLSVVLECGQPRFDCGAYKSATIALAIIAFISIAINVLLTIFLLRKTPTEG